MEPCRCSAGARPRAEERAKGRTKRDNKKGKKEMEKEQNKENKEKMKVVPGGRDKRGGLTVFKGIGALSGAGRGTPGARRKRESV